MRPKKLRMLVVDDEPDNLDLLYRTFRRDFQVFKADSGIRALEVLEEEGEVAVIISDQRMPEMKGTEFLSKTLPQFPDTVRIILTGFTDVQDLVEAINSGQVYRYITKPWDSEELRSVVKKAADTYELLKQRTEELVWVRQQLALMCEIATIADESTDAADGMAKMARAIADPFETSRTVFQPFEDGSATGGSVCAPSDDPCDWLGGDPIVVKAIASKQMEGSVDFSQDKEFSDVGHYKDADVRAPLRFAHLPARNSDRRSFATVAKTLSPQARYSRVGTGVRHANRDRPQQPHGKRLADAPQQQRP